MSPKVNRKKAFSSLTLLSTLTLCQTVEEVVERGLRVVQGSLFSQIASIFLISKDGRLVRAGVYGTDKDGLPIRNTWLPTESYAIDESVVGRALVPEPDMNELIPQWSRKITEDDINLANRNAYLEKLGVLQSAIAVAIYDSSRTYGVLQVVNKTNRNGKVTDSQFSKNDVLLLQMISMLISSAISNLQRIHEFEIVADIIKILQGFWDRQPDYQEIYETISEKLIMSLDSYKACIIRILCPDGESEIVAKSGDNVSWDNFSDIELRKVKGVIGDPSKIRVLHISGNKKIDDINMNWLCSNEIKSWIYIPLLNKDDVVGSLNLFSGFICNLYYNDIKFLETISLLVSYISTLYNVVYELNIAREEASYINTSYINTSYINSRVLSDNRITGYGYSDRNFLHSYKNELINIISVLTRAMSGNPERRNRIIEEQILWLRQRLEEIMMEFDKVADQDINAININEIIRSVIRFFALNNKNISFSCQSSIDIPKIQANEAQMREVFLNLISNAIRAINVTQQKKGEVVVTTDIIMDQIKYIQISVKDDGIGIENTENIFNKEFSTFQGGTGMGLYITRQIVRNYGGRILVNSIQGQGSIFFIRLPLKRLQVLEESSVDE